MQLYVPFQRVHAISLTLRICGLSLDLFGFFRLFVYMIDFILLCENNGPKSYTGLLLLLSFLSAAKLNLLNIQ